MKTLSVIMAVYNGETYLRETIESVLSQTYEDFEFIIVVNCSHDTTLDIIRSFEDSRIFVYETVMCQLAFNLNYALNEADGKYIVRIDADDIAEPTRFAKQLEFIEVHNYDVVGSNITYINENGSFFGEKIYPKENKAIRASTFYKSNIAHPSVMYKKESILAVGGYMNGRVSEDYDLWLRLMRDENIMFYNIQENLTKYRIHANQAKGNKYAFAEIAGYMLRETLYRKSLKCFVGMFVYMAKMVVR